MNPTDKVKTKHALLAILIAIAGFSILTFGSYVFGMWETIGSVISLFGMCNLAGGIYAIIAKRDYKIIKNWQIVVIGILGVLLGGFFIQGF